MGRSKQTKQDSSPKTPDKQKLVKWGLGLASVAAVPVLVMVTGAFDTSALIRYDEVLLVEGQLLLVGSSGTDGNVNRFSRLGYLAPDGTLSARIEDDGAVSVIGICHEVIWVDNTELGIHARRVSDLSAVPETLGKVKGHAALKVKRRALGIAGERVVLDGMDGPYTLTPEGVLEKQSKDFEYDNGGASGALATSDQPLPDGCVPGSKDRAAHIRALHKNYTEMSFLRCGWRRGFVRFDDPPGDLMADTIYTAEDRTRRLARLDDAGELLWGTTIPELVAAAPFDAEIGVLSIPWAGRWDGELRALVQNAHHERTNYDGETRDYTTIEHRLVVLDAKTGQPTSATALVMPEE